MQTDHTLLSIQAAGFLSDLPVAVALEPRPDGLIEGRPIVATPYILMFDSGPLQGRRDISNDIHMTIECSDTERGPSSIIRDVYINETVGQ